VVMNNVMSIIHVRTRAAESCLDDFDPLYSIPIGPFMHILYTNQRESCHAYTEIYILVATRRSTYVHKWSMLQMSKAERDL
jgi:hypothetical protein